MKAGGIIGIIAGTFAVIAALITLFAGGLGGALGAEGANTVVGLGWGGVLFSFLAIAFGAVAISRPRGGGLGLIVVSILGAILGGTLVAIFMVLSLIGGVLAVAGSKKEVLIKTQESATASRQVSAKKSTNWLWLGGSAVIIVIALLAVRNFAPSQPKTDPILDLVNARASSLQPSGELAALFALGSKGTNLQREKKLKEIDGQVVEWTLPIYEVSRDGEGYKVQTQTKTRFGSVGGNVLGTFVYLTPRSEEERQRIEALKTDDLITFKGRIAGSMMRNLSIRPAVLAEEEGTHSFGTESPGMSQELAGSETPTTTIESYQNKNGSHTQDALSANDALTNSDVAQAQNNLAIQLSPFPGENGLHTEPAIKILDEPAINIRGQCGTHVVALVGITNYSKDAETISLSESSQSVEIRTSGKKVDLKQFTSDHNVIHCAEGKNGPVLVIGSVCAGSVCGDEFSYTIISMNNFDSFPRAGSDETCDAECVNKLTNVRFQR